MILVTGAAGHIGNVLVRELLNDGKEVRALILPGEDISSLRGLDVDYCVGNVLDPRSLDKAMQNVDIVYHLAGVISIMPGQNQFMHRVNVEGTRNVLAAARKAHVKRLIYTSSIHALSRNWKGKIDENVPFDPQNQAGEYDRTKAEASLAVLEAVKKGLDAVIVCPTGVVGPFDFRGSEMGDLLRTWLRKRPHFLIEGAYDFVDVRDVARGQILACERGRTGEVYILSGWRVRIMQLKQMVQDAIGQHSITIKVPTWLAKFGTLFTPLYYRLSKQIPKFTEYSIETVQSNSEISNQKAKNELGYNPREMLATIADTVLWWLAEEGKPRINSN
jgi:dihydroflavonol-4-reductase